MNPRRTCVDFEGDDMGVVFIVDGCSIVGAVFMKRSVMENGRCLAEALGRSPNHATERMIQKRRWRAEAVSPRSSATT